MNTGEAGLPFQSLLRAARRGCGESFASLMAPNRDYLLRIAENLMDKRLRQILEPEDVLQDVSIAASRSLSTAHFADENAFKAWLTTLTRHRVEDLRRHHNAQIRKPPPGPSLDGPVAGGADGSGPDAKHGIAGRATSPSDAFAQGERREIVLRLLAGLSPLHREVLRLHWFERLSTTEISVHLGKSTEAVRKALPRALEACRRALEKGGLIGSEGDLRA